MISGALDSLSDGSPVLIFHARVLGLAQKLVTIVEEEIACISSRRLEANEHWRVPQRTILGRAVLVALIATARAHGGMRWGRPGSDSEEDVWMFELSRRGFIGAAAGATGLAGYTTSEAAVGDPSFQRQ
jgi:hypothetical protein